MDNTGVNAAILERLEKVVQSLQENSVKMGELLAVHNEKLDKQDQIDGISVSYTHLTLPTIYSV